MRIACWITKATDTHSEYEIHIAFARQKWLRERSSISRLYVNCPSRLFPSYLDPFQSRQFNFIFPGCSTVRTFHVATYISVLFFLYLCPNRDPKHPSRREFNCTVLFFSINLFLFTGLGCKPNAQPPTWRTKVSLSATSLSASFNHTSHTDTWPRHFSTSQN
jgi:hypothetical protein